MEVKSWTYDEFPEFCETVEGAVWLETTGGEVGVRYTPDVPYASYTTEAGDLVRHVQILRPFTRNEQNHPSGKLLPCVVYVQGSAWRRQDMYTGLPQFTRLAARGYVVAVVEYRDSGVASFPAPIVDARNAVRFLRAHASEYGIDATKIALSGSSSGGHTAVYAAMWSGAEENLYPDVSAEVSCVIDYYGSASVMADDSNPSTLDHNLPTSPEGLEMGSVNLREHPELMRLLSIECNISQETSIPPVIIFHGTKDRTVNVECSITLYRRLRECGKKARLYLLRGADHGGAEFWSDEVLDIVDSFLREQFSTCE